jgi:addiction module RelE/StbE family toxin
MKRFRVVWTLQARDDLKSIQRYIAQSAPATAKSFIARIRDRVRTLVTLPHAAVPLTDPPTSDLREMFVGSYRIIFRVLADEVQVIAVVHGARLWQPDDNKDPEP